MPWRNDFQTYYSPFAGKCVYWKKYMKIRYRKACNEHTGSDENSASYSGR